MTASVPSDAGRSSTPEPVCQYGHEDCGWASLHQAPEGRRQSEPHPYEADEKKPYGVCRCGRWASDPLHVEASDHASLDALKAAERLLNQHGYVVVPMQSADARHAPTCRYYEQAEDGSQSCECGASAPRGCGGGGMTHRDPYCLTHCPPGHRHSQCGCDCGHELAAKPESGAR